MKATLMTDVTRILSRIEQGDAGAAEELLPLVYDELRKLAAAKLAQEKPGQTLQATALVHEVYLRVVGAEKARQWKSRGHFFGAAAEAMRRILIENARRKKREKHGGQFHRVALDEFHVSMDSPPDELLRLDETLEELAKKGLDELRRMIREKEPPRPSYRVSTLQADMGSTVSHPRGVDQRQLTRVLRGELDWIVMKALEKNRNRRYESASALASDVKRHLNHEPVAAGPPSALYRFRKFARKHGIALAATGLVMVTTIAGMIISLFQTHEAHRARRLADAHLMNEKRALAEVSDREARLWQQLYTSDLSDAWQAWHDGELESARSILNRYLPVSGHDDLREFSWHYLNARCSYEPTTPGGHSAPILTSVLEPKKHLLASGDSGGEVKVWNTETWSLLASWRYSEKEVTAMAFSPDGQVLATAGQDATIRLWNVDDWTERACLRGHTRTVCGVSWSPDGKRLVSGARDNSIRFWNVETKLEEKCLVENDVVRCVVWLPDGLRIAAAVGNSVRTWRVTEYQPQGELVAVQRSILSLTVSPDGRLLAAGGYDSNVVLLDLTTNKEVMRLSTKTGTWSLAFSPDGRFLSAGLGRGGPNIWEVRSTDHRLEVIRAGIVNAGRQRAVILDPADETFLMACEQDRVIRAWNEHEVFGYSYASFLEDCLAIALPRDLAIGSKSDGTIVVRHLSDGQFQTKLYGHQSHVVQGVVSKSCNWLATIGADNQILVWDLNSFQLHYRLEAPYSSDASKTQLVFSPDEQLLAAGSHSRSVRIWRVDNGTVLRDVHADIEGAARVAFAPDSRVFATTAGDSGVHFWSSDGDRITTCGVGLNIVDLQFTPDNRWLIGAGWTDGTIVWEIPSGKELFRLLRHLGQVDRVAVSPDGRTLATASDDNTVRLRHLPTGRDLFTLFQHSSRINWLEFASSTKLLVGSSLNEKSPKGVFVFDAGQLPRH